MAELDPDDLNLVDDVISIVNALVPDDGGARSKHWNDSARILLAGLILCTLTLPESERNSVTARELLCLTYAPLLHAVKAAADRALVEASPEEKRQHFDRNGLAIKALLNRMITMGSRFGGIAAAIGTSFQQTPQQERGSIFSTAAAHTDFLLLPLRATQRRSDFRLSTLRSDRPATIYMCLPVGRMERHARRMRIIVQLTCTVLESFGSYPRDQLPILFLMEEFAVLGHMDFMERAAAYFPGFGVKLWGWCCKTSRNCSVTIPRAGRRS
ncbi:type IV secretory system conjugative DNA transfer family protein [Bradyrhizobium sp. IC3069]|uniref:type IV secretory system conjugative DNA transfer family protein n=1 Tax=unclassified Bradyrhizobium TaxID=2631580 RepID=UPI0023DF40CC|nr:MULTISPECIES: type IV secretory system conjugative DNA transfer family protein [unclassified Bradyrhizobium]MCA1363411.1 type IV secretory system conjugative DNA transfer family protein [Bradyrhizobium sp. IC4059]MCA1520949.1 type IV secretory system conjugative DNA transfer family protein [Bradyrhizobium sp. IC3069]